MAMAILSWMIGIPVLGAMTGLRCMTPMAMLCWFAYLHRLPIHYSWALWVANPITVGVFTVLALGELVGDKLPQTPSRLDIGPLASRVIFGGLVGAIAATALRGSAVEGIVLGAIGALGGAFTGYHIRAGIKHHTACQDLPIAFAEDIVTIGLSFLAIGIVTG
ncbi:Uncharacterized membrane protein [Granulicella rosea]|uniref:Uncharacterized membrane protein n=1 Tax=Granulicella rosea TaxID=474952 RepID=A0A239DK12_9BACT|nr:DUF4126 family protein [Granulicella rosea]SNS32955.1 Uncharacterized membrane protein [Granulicella rosea]